MIERRWHFYTMWKCESCVFDTFDKVEADKHERKHPSIPRLSDELLVGVMEARAEALVEEAEEESEAEDTPETGEEVSDEYAESG